MFYRPFIRIKVLLVNMEYIIYTDNDENTLIIDCKKCNRCIASVIYQFPVNYVTIRELGIN